MKKTLLALLCVALVTPAYSVGKHKAAQTAATPADEPPSCATRPDYGSVKGRAISAKDHVTGVTPPKLAHYVEASFSEEARNVGKKLREDGFLPSVIDLTVDTAGNPADLCLERAAGYGLDAEAGKAVQQYRFQPAMKDGEPVAMRVAIEVHFRFR